MVAYQSVLRFVFITYPNEPCKSLIDSFSL